MMSLKRIVRPLHSPWQSLKNQVYLGNDKFVKEHIDSITNEDIELSEIPKSQRKAKPKEMEYYKNSQKNVTMAY